MGPLGETESDRAGELGEYHHSRNLTKKIAVGSNRRSESRRVFGEAFTCALSHSKTDRRTAGFSGSGGPEFAARLEKGSVKADTLIVWYGRRLTKSSIPNRRMSTPIQFSHGRYPGTRSKRYPTLYSNSHTSKPVFSQGYTLTNTFLSRADKLCERPLSARHLG